MPTTTVVACTMIDLHSQNLELLRSVTSLILDSQRPAHTLRPEVLEMMRLLIDSGTFRVSDQSIGRGETQTSNGLAISPTMAAMCAREYVRTIQFLRGTHAAILEIRKQYPDRPARVLEVGCGPIATLVAPLMTIFSPKEAQFTLLDLHSESIESAKLIVETLGLADSVASWETMDASSYQVAPGAPPDVILMEIMQACLKAEPQVAITRHLLPQAPNAILIPEEVRIDLILSDSLHKFDLDGSQKDGGKIQRDRIQVASVFVLNRETVNSWTSINGDQLPGAAAQLPDSIEQGYRPLLFTTIHVYQHHTLKFNQCSLTLPRKIPIKETIKAGDTIQFHYELGREPRLTGRVIASAVVIEHVG